MQLRKKEQETSNRLLDVQGHSVPEAEVIYIYLFPFLSSSLSLWRMFLIQFPYPQVPWQVCEFKQVTFQEQTASSYIYTKLSQFFTSPKSLSFVDSFEKTSLFWFEMFAS